MKCNSKFKERLNDLAFLWQFSWDDFKAKYAGSIAGVLWAILNPLSTILLYWFVFQVGFHSQPVENYPFILWLISGLMPWFFLSDAISSSTSSLVEYSYLVKKVRFNIALLPIVKGLSTFYVQIALLLFLFLLFVAYGYAPTLYYLQLPIYILYMWILTAGLSYLLSTIYVFYKDILQLVSILLQVAFWTTPIVWKIDTIPYPEIQALLSYTPFYYIVSGYRNTFINKIWFWEAGIKSLYYWLFALVTLFIGFTSFHKCKKHFADVL